MLADLGKEKSRPSRSSPNLKLSAFTQTLEENYRQFGKLERVYLSQEMEIDPYVSAGGSYSEEETIEGIGWKLNVDVEEVSPFTHLVQKDYLEKPRSVFDVYELRQTPNLTALFPEMSRLELRRALAMSFQSLSPGQKLRFVKEYLDLVSYFEVKNQEYFLEAILKSKAPIDRSHRFDLPKVTSSKKIHKGVRRARKMISKVPKPKKKRNRKKVDAPLSLRAKRMASYKPIERPNEQFSNNPVNQPPRYAKLEEGSINSETQNKRSFKVETGQTELIKTGEDDQKTQGNEFSTLRSLFKQIQDFRKNPRQK